MREYLFAIVLVVAPTAGLAQINTSAGGSVNTSAGGAVSGQVNTGVSTSAVRRPPGTSDEPPLDVKRYVEKLQRSGGGGAGQYSVGDAVPGSMPLRSVPGYPQWGVGSSGGDDVIVNRDTGTVSAVVH